MGYFRKFGLVDYSADYFNKRAVDLFTSVMVERRKIDKNFVFQKAIVQSGQRPEHVAFNLYKRAEYYWVLLVINNMVNPYTDWPMSDDEVELYTKKKYENINAIHHFYNVQEKRIADPVKDAKLRTGELVNQDFLPVTNLTYERELNQSKREIIIVNPDFVQEFVEGYEREIENNA